MFYAGVVKGLKHGYLKTKQIGVCQMVGKRSKGILEKEWGIYKKKCVHPEASERQSGDLKCAMYAGASVILAHLLKAGRLPEAESFVILEGLLTETEEFYTTKRHFKQ